MVTRLTALTVLLGVLVGCDTDSMSRVEALEALGEVNRSSRGDQATEAVVEVSTDFTVGGALEAAASTVAEFWETQAPCTDVTLEGAVLTVDYGTLADACTFRGRTYAGVNTVEVRSTSPGSLEVLHDWSAFTDGRVTVDGGATVTWSAPEGTRRVQTAHTWTDDAEGLVVDVVGDHEQGLLDADAGLLGGFTMDGTREWTSDGDVWALDMTGLEIRLIDPAPQAGQTTVTSPSGKSLQVSYSRVDEDTIQAVLSGVRGGDRTVHISALGQLDEVD